MIFLTHPNMSVNGCLSFIQLFVVVESSNKTILCLKRTCKERMYVRRLSQSVKVFTSWCSVVRRLAVGPTEHWCNSARDSNPESPDNLAMIAALPVNLSFVEISRPVDIYNHTTLETKLHKTHTTYNNPNSKHNHQLCLINNTCLLVQQDGNTTLLLLSSFASLLIFLPTSNEWTKQLGITNTYWSTSSHLPSSLWKPFYECNWMFTYPPVQRYTCFYILPLLSDFCSPSKVLNTRFACSDDGRCLFYECIVISDHIKCSYLIHLLLYQFGSLLFSRVAHNWFWKDSIIECICNIHILKTGICADKFILERGNYR